MVGRRGEAPLVPPYKFRRSKKAMALLPGKLTFARLGSTAMFPPFAGAALHHLAAIRWPRRLGERQKRVDRSLRDRNLRVTE